MTARISAPPVIAIDGPSASGKGTVAQRVAQALGFHYLDSGALYRLVAVAAKQAGVAWSDEAALAPIAATLDARFEGDEIYLNQSVVTDIVRSEEASLGASTVAVCRAGLDMQRRITLNAVVIDLRTQTAQGINEIADRPLVHTGHARQTIIAAAKCQRRRQRTKGSTGIAEKQFGALDCKRPARPAHAQNTARLIRDINPQQTQCVEHAARVVGIQHVVNEGVSPRQCSQQQNAVGNAFRTRQL